MCQYFRKNEVGGGRSSSAPGAPGVAPPGRAPPSRGSTLPKPEGGRATLAWTGITWATASRAGAAEEVRAASGPGAPAFLGTAAAAAAADALDALRDALCQKQNIHDTFNMVDGERI